MLGTYVTSVTFPLRELTYVIVQPNQTSLGKF